MHVLELFKLLLDKNRYPLGSSLVLTTFSYGKPIFALLLYLYLLSLFI